MRSILLFLLVFTMAPAFAQSIDKDIQEKNVSRVLKTLSSDEMKGRSAKEPQQMETAIKFIESEFKSAGLKPLEGLNSFRQEFEKDMVKCENLSVMVNNEMVTSDHTVLLSQEEELFFTSDLSIKYVTKQENLFKVFGQIMQDTTDKIVVIDPAHSDNFNKLREYAGGKRFFDPMKKTGTSVFVLSSDSVQSYSINAQQSLSKLKLTNVVGQLPGKTKPDESVIFSAHYDHLGIIKSVDGDSIANGADDDASGTTAVIELARYFKRANKNNRTLIFAAFTAEEVGGYGSKYFSEQLDPEKIVAMFNIEMIGKPSKWGKNSAFMTGFERSDLGSILQKNLQGSEYQIHPDPYPQQNLFYRSDNATLARLGVPAHSISTDQIDSDQLYHTVNDEFETLDISNVTATIRAIALSATSIISGTDTPSRINKEEVE